VTTVKVHYNAPVTLSFAVATLVIQIISATLFPKFTGTFFAVGPTFSFARPLDYWRLVSHVMGHVSFEHLFSNLFLLLLLGPILEEKYGSTSMLQIILATAFATGVINVLFFPKSLLGASGIVFALIVLVSIVNVKEGSLPLSFILVTLLFIGRELFMGLTKDDISQTAHIVGGIVGALFGFNLARSPHK
jgi:membrane associated rhomboid family serine protease